MNNILHICFATNSNWLRFTQCAIYDIIIRKNKDTKIIFYVLLDKIKRNNTFDKFCTIDNVNVITKEVNSDEEFPGAKRYRTRPWIDKFGYLRLLIPNLDIFKDVERVLYLDVDVLARKDLSDLYFSEMNGKALNCVKEYHLLEQTASSYKYCNTSFFAHTGFMLMDLQALRDLHFTEKCKVNSQYISTDSAIISNTFSKNINYLDPKYMIPYHHIVSKEYDYRNIEKWNKLFGTNYKDINELVQNSYLWHFCCDKENRYKETTCVKTSFDLSETRLLNFESTEKVMKWKPEDDIILSTYL